MSVTRHDTAQNTFAFAADGIHFQFRVYDLKGSKQHESVEFVMPWSKFPLVLRESAVPDVMWGPKGDRLLLCVYGYKDIPCASYSLTTRQLKYYDQPVGPFCFEACLGLSPCQSDNAGFLAARKDLKTDEYLLGPLPGTDIVLATWDGQILEIETEAESELSEDELLHAVIGSQVPFEARWSGKVAVLSSCDAEVRIDTGKGTMCFRRLGPTSSPAMHTGRRVLQLRTQSRTLGGGKATVQIVEDRMSDRYRIVVQKDDGPQETLDAGLMLKTPTPSLLCTSPDNRYVVVTCFTPDCTFHLLIDERGLVVKVLGDTGSNWRRELRLALTVSLWVPIQYSTVPVTVIRESSRLSLCHTGIKEPSSTRDSPAPLPPVHRPGQRIKPIQVAGEALQNADP